MDLADVESAVRVDMSTHLSISIAWHSIAGDAKPDIVAATEAWSLATSSTALTFADVVISWLVNE